MARKGGGSTKKGHAWAGRQSPKLQDIKFPKYFKTDAVKYRLFGHNLYVLPLKVCVGRPSGPIVISKSLSILYQF